MRILPVSCAWFLLVCIAFCAGCGGSVEIHLADRADFELFRTWSWLPNAARTIDAPPPYRIGLDRELANLVHAGLSKQGFAWVERGADLRMGALLNVRREYENVIETGAVEQLSTFTSDGVYEIQRSVVRKQTWERARLVIFAVDPTIGKRVWTGSLERRFKGEFPPHVGTVVADLLAAFPTAGSGRAFPDPHELAASPGPVAAPEGTPREPGA
jgi:hypothetical protein